MVFGFFARSRCCAIAGVRLKLMLVYVDTRRRLTKTMQIAFCAFFRTITIGFAGGDAVRLVAQGRWRPGDGRWHEVNKFPHNEKFAMPARCAEKSLEFTSGS
jgi:hypothetical protein